MTAQELKQLKENLWTAAIKLRADSDLKLNEFSTPVLGLIFLKFADNKFKKVEAQIQAELKAQQNSRRQRPEHEIAIEKCGFFLPPRARYDYLLHLPEEEDIDLAIKAAMQLIEEYKPELEDTLPQDEYFDLTRVDKSLPKTLLKLFKDIPENASGDVFGQIYEFFLGKFAMAEGQGGGEFFTPTSVVKYMVEVIEPYQGTIFDPACGSGGMFVQSAHFIDRRKTELQDSDEKDFFVYGSEKTLDTVKLAKMNIAVNGLRGRIVQANSYYEDPFGAFGQFDYVMANPPFNVRDVNADRVKDDRRFNTYGLPQNKSKGSKRKKTEANTVPNANYLWINLFATSLKPEGRAALVMANSASDARHSEQDIRKTLVRRGLISQMVTLPSNMFTTVTLPASLWFFDKSREIQNFETEKDQIRILFIDARNIFRQLTRAHREFTDEQLWNLAAVTRLHRGRREGFTALVHQYIQGLADNLQTTATLILAAKEALERLAAELAKVADLSDDFTLPDPQPLHDFAWQTLEVSRHYLITTQPEEVETCLPRQLQLGERYAQLLEQAPPYRKKIEKAYRELEKAYKSLSNGQAKQLIWTPTNSPKNTRIILDQLAESLQQNQPLDPKWTPKSALYFMRHIRWLQERFPEAKYEDVTGLCKSAGIAEIEEQDYSLNPGRYVGVVIEEDGMTEEEFEERILSLNEKLSSMNILAHTIEKQIENNIRLLFDENV